MFDQLENALICWKDTVVGTVRNIEYNFPHFYANFFPSKDDDIFRELFAILMDEESVDDPPFGEDLLSEDNWYLQRPDGTRDEISLPAINYSDGIVDWRLR